MNTNYSEILKKTRENKNLSAKEAAGIAKIPESVVVAFENADKTFLPARVYARGFLARYLDALDVSGEIDAPAFLDLLFGRDKDDIIGLPSIKKDLRPIYKTHVFIFIAVIAILSVSSYYIYFQFRFLLKPPSVVIYDPAYDFITYDDFIMVKGKADPDSVLTVNGRPLYINETGEFSERVNLAFSLNALEFEARNKAGKITKIVRYILVK